MTKACWICGQKSDSGEHIVKSSDIKRILGESRNRIFLNNDRYKNKIIQSRKSDLLKYKNSICHDCNTNKTASHDAAWDILSSHMINRRNVKPGDRIKLNKVFRGSHRDQSIRTHLYFVKLFGCFLNEVLPSFNLTSLSYSILNNKAHSKIFLEFGSIPIKNQSTIISRSDLVLVGKEENPSYMCWLQHLHHFSVSISYFGHSALSPTDKLWNPQSNQHKVLKITDLSPNNSFKPTRHHGVGHSFKPPTS